jgi:hypothetical protein
MLPSLTAAASRRHCHDAKPFDHVSSSSQIDRGTAMLAGESTFMANILFELSLGLYSGTVGGGLDIVLRAMTQLSKSTKIL